MRLGFLRGMMIKNPDQALQELKKLEIGTRRMSEILRNMVFLLRPMALDGTSMSAAIEAAVQKTRDKEGTEVRFEGGEFGALLDDDAKSVVRYIVEQGLSDAKEFGQSNRINVGLWRENDLFIARVEDNGRGLDVATMGDTSNAPQALNLAFMNERAQRISSELAADSTPGIGTTLTLVIPLDKHGRDRTRQL
jgi:signal transduction histidine kinase